MASIVRMILVLSLLCASSGFILSYLKMTTAGSGSGLSRR